MRVVVIFPGALGDLCLLAPALAVLHAGGAEVALSVRRALESIAAALLPEVALGPPLDGVPMASLFGDTLAPDVSTWLRGADRVHAWLPRADVAPRLATAGVDVHYHTVPRGDGASHVGDAYALALGVPPATVLGWRPRVRTPPARALPWRGLPPGRLVLHPGAGARGKRWAPEGFRRAADDWVRAGGHVVVLLGPAEEDEVGWWRRGAHPVVDDLTLADAPAAIASAVRWLGNDSGMSQLAGALGRRGVVLFGPTRPERWRPRGGALTAVRFDGRAVDDVCDDVRRALGAPDLDTPTPRH